MEPTRKKAKNKSFCTSSKLKATEFLSHLRNEDNALHAELELTTQMEKGSYKDFWINPLEHKKVVTSQVATKLVCE